MLGSCNLAFFRLAFYMNYDKYAKSLTFRRGSGLSQGKFGEFRIEDSCPGHTVEGLVRRVLDPCPKRIAGLRKAATNHFQTPASGKNHGFRV